MTKQEKLEHIKDAAMLEARMQANTIIGQHRKALENINEQHRAEQLRQSETRIKAETTAARQQLSMAASKAQLELKRELGKTQKKFKKALFAEVSELLSDYMKTEEYKINLIAYIEKAAAFAGGEAMTLYINPSDEDKKGYLEEHTGMTLTVSKEDFTGGLRAVIHERNILIDYAFKGAMEREYQKFAFKGGTGIGD
ncbi:MAG: V-type ATP synthase subunit E [Lachnospiraceae bacterium]